MANVWLRRAADRTAAERLTVFASGGTPDAAETVCSGDRVAAEDVLD
jgi:hypothetical protein